MADALKTTSDSLASNAALADIGGPDLQDLFKNVAAQLSSPIVKDAMKSFATVKVPPDVLGINKLKIAGSIDPAVLDQFAFLSKLELPAFAGPFTDIKRQSSIAAALGAFDSAVLVKNLVPDMAWVKAWGASSAANAMLAELVGGLSSLAADIAGTTARLASLSPPKGKWFENVDLGINSWSTLVKLMPPQPSPRQLGSLSLMGTGALAVAETGLILTDDEFVADAEGTDFSFWRESLRASMAELGTDLILRLDGAWERVSRPGPDAASQAAHSLVECIDLTLRTAAPTDDVLSWYNATGQPNDELDGNGGPTRRLRLRYLLRDRSDEAEVAELQIQSLIGIMKQLQKKKHSEPNGNLQAVARMIPAIEAAMAFILPWDIQ